MINLYTKNDFHLGDNIYCMIMFSKVTKYIEDNNILINHYCLAEHVDQINEFKCSNNITILPLDNLPNGEKIHDLWVGSSDYENNFFKSIAKSENKNTYSEKYFDSFLCSFYSNVLHELNIPFTIDKFIFDDDITLNDLLIRNKKINEKTQNKYIDIDILIVNGTPQSQQIVYDKQEWDNNIILLSKKYNIVTTQKVDGIICTRDDDLSAKDIASISINAKKIIAIDSGVSLGFFNKYTIEKSDIIYYLCQTPSCTCSFPNFTHKETINDVVDLLLNDKHLQEPFGDIFKLNYTFVFPIFFVFLIVYLIKPRILRSIRVFLSEAKSKWIQKRG
jgi:hypothetical protein